MKYVKYLLLIVALTVVSTVNVNAASCPSITLKELSEIAGYVKATYEVIDNSTTQTMTIGEDKTEYLIPIYSFNISLYNITDDIYVIGKDDITNERFNVNKENTTEGIYTIQNTDYGRIYNYTFEIYSNRDNCTNQKIRTIKLVKPMYNPYSEYAFCKNSTNYYCQKFTEKNLGITNKDDFLKKIEVNNNKSNPNNTNIVDSTVELIKNNWKLYLIIFAVVIVIMVGIIIYMKKKNKTKGWKL